MSTLTDKQTIEAIQRESIKFPKQSYYKSYWNLVGDAYDLQLLDDESVDPLIIFKLVNNMHHLTKEYQDYLLLNANHTGFFMDDMYYSYFGDVLITKVLRRLIECNLFLKHSGHEYSLPTMMGRQFSILEDQLVGYLNARHSS